MRSKKTAETACVKIGRDGGRESNEGESRLQWSARFFSRRFRSSTHCLLVEAKGTGEKMRPRLDSQRGGARRTVSFGSFLVTSRFLLTSSLLWSPPLATDIPLLNNRSAAILSVSSPSSLIDLTKKACAIGARDIRAQLIQHAGRSLSDQCFWMGKGLELVLFGRVCKDGLETKI